jgi:hypothetical protein
MIEREPMSPARCRQPIAERRGASVRRRARLVVAAAVGVVSLVALAAPAGAAATTVVANQRYQWFWWIAPILAFSFLGMVGFLSAGYIRKVILPRYRGRRVEE